MLDRLGHLLDTARLDAREAARRLGRSPLFALTATLSLAVGIGANVAIFSVVNALLLRPAPGVAEPDRLVDIGRSQNGEGFDNNSYPNFLDVRRRATTLVDTYAQMPEPRPLSLGREGGAERIYGGLVSANYFRVLGTRPLLGRLFDGDEDDRAPGTSAVAVISHGLWTRRFAADPGIVGRAIVLNGHPFAVLGVAPPGFRGTTILAPDAWVPLSMVDQALPRRDASLLRGRESVWLLLGGRLRPGVTLEQSRAELAAIGRDLEREFPRENDGRGLRIERSSLFPGHTGPIAAFLGLLMALVGSVLAIACANLAGVLLARAASRRREIALRVAIGAGRSHLLRLLLTETLLLFLAGAAAGLLLARGLTSLLVALLPALPVPVDMSVPLDARVAAFTLALTLAAAVLSGLVPAAEAARTDVLTSLRSGAAARSPRLPMRSVLVTGQIALSLALSIGAFLFLRALQRAGTIDPGFDPRGVELVELDLSLAGYTSESGPALARRLVERARALPGVAAASTAAVVPLGGGGLGLGELRVPGTTPGEGDGYRGDWNVVEPGYFAAMKTALVAGRDFTPADADGSLPVIILNEAAARRFFPGQDALGRVLEHRASPSEARRLTVVGVARDGKYRSLGEQARAFVYVPLAQQYFPRVTLVARVEPDRRLQPELRALVASLDPGLPVVRAQSLSEHAALGLLPQRVAASVSGSLGLVGLLLAAVGIYGVTAYGVAQRTREIGVRMALGAQRSDVVRLVLRQGMTLAGVGLAIGLGLAAALGRLLGSLLFGVPGTDPVAFGGATALLLAIGLLACLVPARRATRASPVEALRCE
jgi:predicted permease